MASLKIIVRSHWLSSMFLRIFARPVVLIDGTEYLANWGVPWTGNVEAGDHIVGAGIRYRGTSGVLGVSLRTVTLSNHRETVLSARNGVLNHSPFHLEEVSGN